MGRLYMEHGYDGYMTSYINDEKDEVTQTRMLFYLATHYLLTGRDRLALTYYLAVTDVQRPDIFEIRLAEKEIQKRQSN